MMALRTRTITMALIGLLVLIAGSSGCKDDAEKLDVFLANGDRYVEQEQFPEAIIEYRNVLQIDPNHAVAHEKLYAAYMRMGRAKEAYWELGETIRLQPDNVVAQLKYATISLLAQSYDKALEHADKVIVLDEEMRPEATLVRARALMALERHLEAEAALREVVELQPNEGNNHVVLGAYLIQRERAEEGEAELREAVKVERTFLTLNALASYLMTDPLNDEEAEKIFKQLLELAKEPTEEGGQKPELLSAYNAMAHFYLARERVVEAIEVLEEGAELVEEGNQELVYTLAKHYRNLGEIEKSDAMIDRIAAQSPEDPAPFLLLSARRSREGDMEGALEAADKALEADPEDVRARLRRAELLIDLGFRDKDEALIAEAKEIIDQVVAADPNQSDAAFVRGKLELAKGEHQKAVATLATVVENRPEWSQAHFVYGSALLLTGDIQRARAELSRSLELSASAPQARRLLTKVHSELGEHEYAIEHGRKYLTRFPEDDETRILVAQSLVRLGKLEAAAEELSQIPEERRNVQVLYAMGRLEMARQNLDGAEELLKKADALRPNTESVLSSLLSIGRARGNIDDAAARIDKAVAAEPENAKLHRLKGTVALLKRDFPTAETHLAKAIELDPGNLDAYRQLGGLYRATGRVDETIALSEKAVEAHPEQGPPHHFLAVLYEMSGRTDDAKKQYREAIKADPNLFESKNNLAYLLAEEGKDLDEALMLAQEAKAGMPDNASAADTLGWVLYKRKVPSAAIGYLREAVQSADPTQPTIGLIRVHLALAYEAAGENDNAIETLEEALAHLEKQMDQRKASGQPMSEPSWAPEARASIDRLRTTG
jgi:tetratricopeptide (TPR) repeat protein